MKIRTQIIGLVSVILGLMIIGGVFLYWNLSQIRNQTGWLIENDLSINRQLLDITNAHFEHRTFFEQSVEFGRLHAEGKVDKETFRAALAKYQHVCSDLHTQVVSSGTFVDSLSNSDLPLDVINRFAYVHSDLDRIRDQHHICMPRSQEVFKYLKTGQLEMAQTAADRILENESKLDDLLITFLKKLEASNQEILVQTQQREQDVLFWLTTIFILSIIVGLVLSVFISQRIVRSLGYAEGIAERIGFGDRKVDIKTDVTDETRVLLETMRSMLQNLNNAEKELKEANEVLEERVEERTISLEHANGALQEEVDVRKRAEAELMEINRELNTFMYKTSHDLKSPIVSILGILNLTKMEFEKDSSVNQYLDMIHSCTDKLNKVILELNEVTIVKERKESVEMVNLREVMTKVTERVSEEAEAKNVAVSITYRGEEEAASDPVVLESAFYHLIHNAIAYSDPKKDNRFCQVTIDNSSGDQFSIEVVDNGIGIEPTMQEQVFNMFYRGSYLSEGSGLGLYIAKWAAKTMRGTIHMESEAGKGSCFEIKLPALAVRNDISIAS